ncbi:hypothetical protein Dsin_029773 [Dipteronia sinensis]|uniref:Uncharacterized protein n=1 Tax=Dipteronia sinensis TaxID=43782 RepID=A0AAE0DX13_9ROSI|nr:hypothetical protein Dsin_029773 [Dipteronia sinensis]
MSTSDSTTGRQADLWNRYLKFVICPTLLLQVNDNGDTPLHVEAKQGCVAIVEVLINQARTQRDQNLESGVTAVKQMLRMTNNEGNTALHEAGQNHSVGVVKILMREDPEFPYSANYCGETLLYIAASTGSLGAVVEILETYTSATYQGPCGMTALHGAVKRNRLDITRKTLKKKSWTKETDQNEWTSLHYTAYYGYHLIIQLLVEFDASAAYIADNDRQMTALHLAAGQGRFDIIKTITSSCPDCVELVDSRGWNYVHFTRIENFGWRLVHQISYEYKGCQRKHSSTCACLNPPNFLWQHQEETKKGTH